MPSKLHNERAMLRTRAIWNLIMFPQISPKSQLIALDKPCRSMQYRPLPIIERQVYSYDSNDDQTLGSWVSEHCQARLGVVGEAIGGLAAAGGGGTTRP